MNVEYEFDRNSGPGGSDRRPAVSGWEVGREIATVARRRSKTGHNIDECISRVVETVRCGRDAGSGLAKDGNNAHHWEIDMHQAYANSGLSFAVAGMPLSDYVDGTRSSSVCAGTSHL